ncbi:MAG: nitroreductase family protein [Chloroflexi bacterium]|nr:nitroreductase family protein [Chloroflexota bacterium]
MNYDHLLELVKSRRSIRKFKPDPIPDEYVDKIIEAARWAPSGANCQPWEFVIVKNKETKEKIYEFITEMNPINRKVELTRPSQLQHHGSHGGTDGRPGYMEAPVFIITCSDSRKLQGYHLSSSLTRGRDYHTSAMASAFLCMHLAATSLGLGSQWISATNYALTQARIRSLLGIPGELEIYDTMAVGYPALRPGPRLVREREEMMHRERFDHSKFKSRDQIEQFIAGVISAIDL